MSTCPVVRIASPEHAQYGGFVEINESDFNSEIHTLFIDGEAAKKVALKSRKVVAAE